MTTMGDLVADVRRTVYGSMSEQINLLKEPYTAGADSLEFTLDVSPIQPGMVLSAGLNVWYVTGVNVAGNVVSVFPGYDNSRSDALDAGVPVFLRPRMTGWYAFKVLNDEIRRLSSPSHGLYRIGSWTANSDSLWQTYEVPVGTSFSSIARVRYLQPGTPDVWVDLPNSGWRYDAGNQIVQILRWLPSSVDVQFVYKAPFVPAAGLDDDIVVDCGLAETMTDLPVLGAASQLLMTTESRRNQIQTQGDPRRAAEVPVTGNSTAARQLAGMYKDRVEEEYSRLVASLPIYRGIA